MSLVDKVAGLEAALDWALKNRGGIGPLGKVDTIHRDSSGSWRRTEIPEAIAAVIEESEQRIAASRQKP